MPVTPDPADFPSVLKKGERGNESHDKSDDQQLKASAKDVQSKGPQIPDEMPPKISKEEIKERKKELNQK